MTAKVDRWALSFHPYFSLIFAVCDCQSAPPPAVAGRVCPPNCSSSELIRRNIKRSRSPEADARMFCSHAWNQNLLPCSLGLLQKSSQDYPYKSLHCSCTVNFRLYWYPHLPLDLHRLLK
ncbi:hypothetical protein ATANTOWER_017634 [Ataeniobius toweri]|uniref:Secreted protein n=1 Tax=Ataeniobius toweri TaxID=208326 RepID=A0ABU7APS4_9TELE|nr:hypothetical protein [Ataeniobius toweri]